MRPAHLLRVLVAIAAVGASGCSASIAGTATPAVGSAATPTGPTITLTARSQESNPSSELLSRSIELINQRLADIHPIVSSPSAGTLTIVAPASAQEQVTEAVTISGLISVRPVTLVAVADPEARAPSEQPPVQPPSSDESDWEKWTSSIDALFSTSTVRCGDTDVAPMVEDLSKPLLSCQQDQTQAYLLEPPILDVDDFDSAKATLDEVAGWTVTVSLTAAGSAAFAQYTADHVGQQAAFTMDGITLTAPVIQSAITTPEVQISGNFTEASSRSLAAAIDDGGLPLHFTIE